MEWIKNFDDLALENGKTAFLNNRVINLKEENGIYTASILGRKRYDVSLKKLPSGIQSMSCQCPTAKMGRKCEHMAALMFAIDYHNLPEGNIDKLFDKIQKEKQEQLKHQQEEQEQLKRQQEERDLKKRQREERKAEMARKKEEQKRIAAEAEQREYEKQQAEAERREQIRLAKAEEAKRKAEKRQQEQEAARLAAEKKQNDEKERKKLEARMKKEEEKRIMQENIAKIEAQQQTEKEQVLSDRAHRAFDYEILGNPPDIQEESLYDTRGAENVKALEQYRYFDKNIFRKTLDISDKIIKNGKECIQTRAIEVIDIKQGFSRQSYEQQIYIHAKGSQKQNKFPVELSFTKNKILLFECGCPQCINSYLGWYSKQTSVNCSYKAGLILLTEALLESSNLGDSTDADGAELMHAYRRKHANLLISDRSAGTMNLQLVPRLIRRDAELSLSFKVGQNRLFVIKKLDEFCDNVKESATELYGTSTEINHSEDNFSEKGKAWIRFINRVVQEELEFLERMTASRYYYGNTKESVGAQLELYGWRLDEFVRLLGDDSIEFEDKDSDTKKKQTLTSRIKNPRISIHISEDKAKGEKQFHGIRVTGVFPDLYYGAEGAYFIEDNYLNQTDKEFIELSRPLADLTEYNSFSFRVGRNNLSEFYSRVMPELKKIAEVIETDSEKFHSYLIPDAKFVFYLDLREETAFCRIFAWYGDQEVDILKDFYKAIGNNLEPFRVKAREEEIVYQTMNWFPDILPESSELACSDGNSIYELMKTGTEYLMELGEVHCTKSFLGNHNIRHVKVSLGVSVSSELLNLDITTQNVPREELINILKSYRKKQKYYRMKEGGFVDLEDPSLKSLLEMADSMHLKNSELIKGFANLPLYRTLYLDRLMEENEELYSHRDSHFRELVKGFKTVKDADFEEPASLSGIMRNYQKDGYRWLRTLESWQFGGILADEMGLGKTLQIISVLLAAKEAGQSGVSLVVSPASLVFNWGEEFARFAPALSVSLITGTQEDRQQKLAVSEDYDVLVTSYDLLKRDIELYENKQFHFEIIDEAQYIKNQSTAAAKAVKAIRSRIRYALTGTPIENRLSELWSIFDYLMPGFLYGSDVFRKEIELPAVKNNDEKAMQRLQKMVSPFILRRKKADVLKDLPEKLEEFRYVPLTGKQQKLYDAHVLQMKEYLSGQNMEEFNKSKLQILAELTRLRQICCDPSLCFENYHGETAKLEACLELIQSAMDGDHRMLLFSQFASMLDILMRELDRLGISYYVITGKTPKAQRLELVKQFNEGNVPVFLISLKAGGVGLNLTGADVVIHYDPWWNVAVQNQATDRAHRIGQKNKVTVYKLIARHTIEEKIQKLQETKQDLAEQIIGGELGGLGNLSQEELLSLLEV